MVRTINVRRKREQKTDYKARLALLKSGKPRLVIRRSLNNIIAQVIEYVPGGDKILASAHSRELLKLGWKYNKRNLPAAYLTGMLLAKKSAKKGVKEAIFDLGLQRNQACNRVYACLKGVIEGGLNVPHDPKVLPKQDRIEGKHISEDVSKQFNEMKKKIV